MDISMNMDTGANMSWIPPNEYIFGYDINHSPSQYFWQIMAKTCEIDQFPPEFHSKYKHGSANTNVYDITRYPISCMRAIIGYIIENNIQDTPFSDIIIQMINDYSSRYTHEFIIGMTKFTDRFIAEIVINQHDRIHGYHSRTIFYILYILCDYMFCMKNMNIDIIDIKMDDIDIIDIKMDDIDIEFANYIIPILRTSTDHTQLLSILNHQFKLRGSLTKPAPRL
jgi:hypothetical protein